MRGRTAELGLETIFFILMGIFFVGILLFGLSKIFLLQDELSEQERVEVSLKIKEVFEGCEDPLAKGTLSSVEINFAPIKKICVVSKEGDVQTLNLNSLGEIELLYSAGENVFLLGKADAILDSFSLQTTKTFCSSREGSKFIFKVEC